MAVSGDYLHVKRYLLRDLLVLGCDPRTTKLIAVSESVLIVHDTACLAPDVWYGSTNDLTCHINLVPNSEPLDAAAWGRHLTSICEDVTHQTEGETWNTPEGVKFSALYEATVALGYRIRELEVTFTGLVREAHRPVDEVALRRLCKLHRGLCRDIVELVYGATTLEQAEEWDAWEASFL